MNNKQITRLPCDASSQCAIIFYFFHVAIDYYHLTLPRRHYGDAAPWFKSFLRPTVPYTTTSLSAPFTRRGLIASDKRAPAGDERSSPRLLLIVPALLRQQLHGGKDEETTLSTTWKWTRTFMKVLEMASRDGVKTRTLYSNTNNSYSYEYIEIHIIRIQIRLLHECSWMHS